MTVLSELPQNSCQSMPTCHKCGSVNCSECKHAHCTGTAVWKMFVSQVPFDSRDGRLLATTRSKTRVRNKPAISIRTRMNTIVYHSANSNWTYVIKAVCLVLVAVTVRPVWGRQQEAKVQSSQCAYTLVVNEFDSSKCPTMQADGLGQASAFPGDVSLQKLAYLSTLSRKTQRAGENNVEEGQVAESKGMDTLVTQVRELEGRLLEEMVRSRELNLTLSRQSAALAAAQDQLATYTANFTAIFRSMMYVHRQLNQQRKINKSLNKKLSNVLLDVVEFNNVLARVPTSPRDGAITSKNFDVQTVTKVRSCPGITEKSITFRGRSGPKDSKSMYILSLCKLYTCVCV